MRLRVLGITGTRRSAKFLGWSANQYNPYRMRLIRKGVLNGETYGHVYFTLPEFGRFVVEYSAMLNAE